MYHYKVKMVNSFAVVTIKTTIGLSKPRNHLMQESTRLLPALIAGIKIGDLVRCDGLPYLTRPRAKYIKQQGYNRFNEIETIKYIPIKISSGMWVLRESPIQDFDLKEQRK